MGFIVSMRARGFGVESICKVLTEQDCQVAPRTYRAWKHAGASQRDRTDAVIVDALHAVRGTPEGLYGRRKMVAHLRRQGHRVSHCQVDRLMRGEGMNGVVRGKSPRTTVPGKDGKRAGDLLDRDFNAAKPNQRWVADFAYVRTWSGFVYVAFVIDCYSRATVGWHASTSKKTSLVTMALKMALWRRDHGGHKVEGGLIHHSDAGSQGGF